MLSTYSHNELEQLSKFLIDYAAKKYGKCRAEDLAQDAMLKLLKWPAEVRNLRVSGKTAVHFVAVEEFRRRKAEWVVGHSYNYERLQDHAQSGARMEAAIEVTDILVQLDVKERRVVVLRMTGFTYDEIAEKLGLCEKTVRTHYATAISHIIRISS